MNEITMKKYEDEGNLACPKSDDAMTISRFHSTA